MQAEAERRVKKTTILGVNNAPKDTSIADIVQHFNDKNLVMVKRIKSRTYPTVNFLLEFANSEACENAKEKKESINVNGEDLEPFFAHSDAMQSHRNVVSENKLYVKYPSAVEKTQVLEKLKDFKLVEPSTESNFLFIVCKDQEEQLEIKKKYDGMKIDGKPLSVTFAINKVRKPLIRGRRPIN
ncbi:hypothetical protein NUSPORA_01517 [Nucleospora cyclopteri]